uniref:Uncharacterized protein n=1 Tax=Tolypiocladia glomerulata TaxID=860646 RepID=A0A1Z1MUY3_9FLOR|nr:hypothetical protein [Tolypiocladia glomerulata]ARW69642.1 hypothetical protein [Tolypiocladia glomerulata]
MFDNYGLPFYLYLVTVIILLLVFAFFVSIQLKVLILDITKVIDVLYIEQKKIMFTQENYLKFFSLYLLRYNYFFCISLSELFLENTDSLDIKKNLFIYLGFIYNEINIIDIAEYYYLQASYIDPNDLDINSALIQISNRL